MSFFSGIQEPMDETLEQINLQLRRATEHEKRPGYRKQPRFKNIIHLWEFLLDLLADDDCRPLISWSNKERKEFQLKNPEEIAKRWGAVKRRPGMNHEKMTRSLRFILCSRDYPKGIAFMSLVELHMLVVDITVTAYCQMFMKRALQLHQSIF